MALKHGLLLACALALWQLVTADAMATAANTEANVYAQLPAPLVTPVPSASVQLVPSTDIGPGADGAMHPSPNTRALY